MIVVSGASVCLQPAKPLGFMNESVFIKFKLDYDTMIIDKGSKPISDVGLQQLI